MGLQKKNSGNTIHSLTDLLFGYFYFFVQIHIVYVQRTWIIDFLTKLYKDSIFVYEGGLTSQ